LTLVLCAAGLMAAHVRAWRRARNEPMEPKERDYRRRQYRRRMQSSAMLGLAGVGILLAQVLPRPWNFFALCGVLLLVCWLILLAVVDMLATKFYFGRVRQRYLLEEVKLEAELRRAELLRRNGHSRRRRKKRKPGPGDRGQGGAAET
jgi:hypothetical protein